MNNDIDKDGTVLFPTKEPIKTEYYGKQADVLIIDDLIVDTLESRLRKRAEIRMGATSRRSVQEGKPDKLSALLVEAADEIGGNVTTPYHASESYVPTDEIIKRVQEQQERELVVVSLWNDININPPLVDASDPYKEFLVYVKNSMSGYGYQDVLGFEPELFKFFTDKDNCEVTHWKPLQPDPE